MDASAGSAVSLRYFSLKLGVSINSTGADENVKIFDITEKPKSWMNACHDDNTKI